jgi:uncharacterized protein
VCTGRYGDFRRKTLGAVIPIKETSRGLTFLVKVQPRARRNEITGVVGDALKLSLTAPPVEGRANDAVVEFLADFFDIPRSSVTITSGKTNRLKAICICGIGVEQLQRKLAAVDAQ